MKWIRIGLNVFQANPQTIIQPSGHTVRVQHFDCVRFVFFAEQSLAETKSAVASALVPAQVVKRLTEA